MSIQPKVEKRFHKRVNAMIKRSEGLNLKFQSDEPIYKLLNEFSKFSREYIELLEKVPETISRNSYVVNNGIEKLLQEWNILSRASEQRLIGDLKEHLDKASDLAEIYCKKWNDALPDNSYHKLEKPVVYFEKIYRISMSIYAPQIPAISIPLTDYDQPENWQSLAHELSHHVFWNGFSAAHISSAHQKLRENISTELVSPSASPTNIGRSRYLRQLAERIELWENWLEEIFADVYGTLLAGLSYAISTQDIMAERVNKVDDFLIADHDHPCIYLRPLISLYTLDLIENQTRDNQAEIESLENRWSDFSSQVGSLKYNNIPMDVLVEDAKKIVDILLRGDYWPAMLNFEKLAEPITRELRPSTPSLEPVSDIEDPLVRDYPDLDSIKLPQKFERIKDHLKITSTRIAQTIGGKQPDEEAKLQALQAWLSLAGLELGDTKGYEVHGCTDSHVHWQRFWYKKHYHPQDGSDIFLCS